MRFVCRISDGTPARLVFEHGHHGVDLVFRYVASLDSLGTGKLGFDSKRSPRPMRFSAPGVSKMTRLSMPLATLNEMRFVMFA